MPGRINESNGHNDASIAIILSRKPDSKLQKDIKNIENKQRGDARINRLISRLEGGELRQEYRLRDGVILKGKTGYERILLTFGW